MALGPNTQEFHNLKSAVELAIKEKEIQSPKQLRDYLVAQEVNPDEFKQVNEEYKKNKDRYDAEEQSFSVADVIGGTVNKLGSAAGLKVAQGIELVGGKEAREKVETAFDQAVNYVDDKLKQTEVGRAISNAAKETFDPRLSTGEEVTSELISYAAAARLGGKALNRFQPTSKLGKMTKFGTIGVMADVLMRDEDEQISTEVLNLVPQAKPLVEALVINPDDEAAEKLLKQTIDSAILNGTISAALAPVIMGGSALVKGAKKTFGKAKALKEGVDTPVKNTATHTAKDVEIVETAPGEFRQRGKIEEIVGKINTGLGRAFTSKASMPKELFDSYMNKIKYAESMDLLVKNLGNKLKTLIDEKGLDSVLVNKVLLGEKLSAFELQQFPKGVVEEITSMRTALDKNSSQISGMLGIDPKSKLGIQFKEGEGSYLTRSYEFTTNPKWSKDIAKALKGKLDPTDAHNADVINIVENARKYLKAQNKGLSDANIDALINNIVTRGKKTDSVTAMLELLGKGGPGNALTQKVLTGRKDIDKPILELLGEVKDPVRNLTNTLSNQHKVIAKAQFLNDVKNFAQKNLDQEVELGGLFSFLPKDVATFTKRMEVSTAAKPDTTQRLAQIAEKELGTLGEQRRKLGFGDLSTTEQMYKMIDNGIDTFGIDKPMGQGWTNMLSGSFSRAAALGQASETVLDHTAYAVNMLGAVQSLAMNGNMFRKGAMTAANKAALTVWQKAVKKDVEALKFLQKLKADGIIDSNVISEGIKTNLDRFGNIGPENLWEKAFDLSVRKPLKAASGVYGGIDDIAKTAAIKMEMDDFARAFPEATEEQIYKMAVDRVRDTMHSYTAAIPIVRAASRLPLGTYATFPAETLRTQYNIIKYGLQDIRNGKATGNEELVRMGYRRLVGLGATTAGIAATTAGVNAISGTDDDTLRAINMASSDWQKNTNKMITTGMYKDPKTKEFMYKGTDTGLYDAAQYAQSPVRNIIGRVMAGDDVTERELDEMFTNSLRDIYSPYVSEKFLTTALANVVRGYDEQGRPIYPGTSFADNARAFAKELGSAFVPGTVKSVNKWLNAMKAEEIPGEEGRGVTAAGFPNREKEARLFMLSGIRNYTENFSKKMSMSLFEDTKEIDKTAQAFKQYIKNIPQGPLSEEDKQDIYKEYVRLQKIKLERMAKLKDKVDIFKNAEYSDGESKKKIGIQGVIEAATSRGRYSPNQQVLMAVGGEEGNFLPDSLGEMDIIKYMQDRKFPKDVISSLKYLEGQLYKKKLRPVEEEQE